MKKTLLVPVLFLCMQAALAYPISPLTLLRLMESSTYIVIARVGDPVIAEDISGDEDSLLLVRILGDGIADLHISEVLKGDPGSSLIQVKYPVGLICPAPPRYKDKTTVIAFLSESRDSNGFFYTCGLSYGSKTMYSDAQLNAYRSLIKEYMSLSRLPDEEHRRLATVEWLVKCAENPHTRWEGAYELNRAGDYMALYDRTEDRGFASALNADQYRRLEDVYFEVDTLTYADICLAGLVRKKHHSRLRTNLLKHLQLQQETALTDDIMRLILHISPDKELQKHYDDFSSLPDPLYMSDKRKAEKVGLQRSAVLQAFMQIAAAYR